MSETLASQIRQFKRKLGEVQSNEEETNLETTVTLIEVEFIHSQANIL